MSAYAEQETQFADAELLCSALRALGFEGVECHKTATNLYGYHGDMRPEVAEVIIRRNIIGIASNDVGFKRNADGNFGAIISDYDSSQFNAGWIKQLKATYAEQGIMRQAKRNGLRFTGKKVVKGKTQLQFVKA